MSRLVATLAILTSILLSVLPSIATAGQGDDFAVDGGHFFTQTNGSALGTRSGGYAVSDGDGIPFWTFFAEHGGTDLLGYPVSQRFVWDGNVCQAMQKAVLQWNPSTGRVQLANVFDYLSSAGKDDWLVSTRLAPRAAPNPGVLDQPSQPQSFLNIVHLRFAWLNNDGPIFERYLDTPHYFTLYGLPTSEVQDLGPYLAVRFQRVVMYHWKTGVPWADAKGVSVSRAGELIKELGLIPDLALQPKDSLAGELVRSALPVSTGKPGANLSPGVLTSLTAVAAVPPGYAKLTVEPRFATAMTARSDSLATYSGTATWYGAGFQGSPMADGFRYNMYDPTTTAANVYPLGSWLRVTRLSTGRSIVVQVRDRGDFRYPDIVDLSYAAFSELADPSAGVIRVQVEPTSAN
jgi:hypothetical protein